MSTRRTRGAGERGSAMVEMVFVLPLLVVLVFGTIEFGAAWSNKLKVESAARAGARVGSSLGNARLADYTLLQSVRSAIDDIGLENVSYVVVYNASASNGAIPASCKTSPAPTPQTGLCNVYTGAQLSSLVQGDFSGTSCAVTAPDRFWCPTSRQDVQHLGTDYLGVWIKANSPTVTQLFGSPLKLESKAVMRLEPT